MKKFYIILLIVFAILVVGCSTDSSVEPKGEEVRSEWGKANNGIQAQLFSPQSKYAIGEIIETYVLLKNTTDQNVTFSNLPYKTVYFSINGELIGEGIGEVQLAEESIVLLPGEEKEFLLEKMDTKQGTGTYTFSGGLDGVELPQIEVQVKEKP